MKIVLTAEDPHLYTTERARTFGHSAEQLRELIGSFTLFLDQDPDGHMTYLPPEELNGYVSDEDLLIIEKEQVVLAAQKDIEKFRPSRHHDFYIERSRSTEWLALLQKFIEVVPVHDNKTTAA